MIIGGVDDREFALLGLGEHGVGFGESRAGGGGDEVCGHDGCDGVGEVRVELNIAGGYHADKWRAERAVFCSRSVSWGLSRRVEQKSGWRFLIGLKNVLSAVRWDRFG